MKPEEQLYHANQLAVRLQAQLSAAEASHEELVTFIKDVYEVVFTIKPQGNIELKELFVGLSNLRAERDQMKAKIEEDEAAEAKEEEEA